MGMHACMHYAANRGLSASPTLLAQGLSSLFTTSRPGHACRNRAFHTAATNSVITSVQRCRCRWVLQTKASRARTPVLSPTVAVNQVRDLMSVDHRVPVANLRPHGQNSCKACNVTTDRHNRASDRPVLTLCCMQDCAMVQLGMLQSLSYVIQGPQRKGSRYEVMFDMSTLLSTCSLPLLSFVPNVV